MQGFERSAKAQAVKTTRISWVQLENSTTDGLLAKLCKWLNFIATDALAMVLLQALVTVVAASGMAFLVMWRWFWRRLQGFTGDASSAISISRG